jgi:hypothetical protein
LNFEHFNFGFIILFFLHREPRAGLLMGSGKRVEQGDPVRAPMEKRKMEGRED